MKAKEKATENFINSGGGDKRQCMLRLAVCFAAVLFVYGCVDAKDEGKSSNAKGGNVYELE